MKGAGQFIPLILIFGIMYFLLIRPQQKKLKEHQAMLNALRRGDQVITQGGIMGKITNVDVEEGDVVEKGRFLLEIDPEEYRRSVEGLEAALQSACDG